MKKIIYIALISLVTLSSCNYLDIEPVGQVIPHKVSDYRALLTSAYNNYPTHRRMLSLPSDEVETMNQNEVGQVYTPYTYNIVWQHNVTLAAEYPYIEFYTCMFHTVEILDKIMGAEKDTNDDEADRKQIKAEAHALRAYSLFDLLNLYAKYEKMWYDPSTEATDRGVPLYTKIDIMQKFVPVSVKEVYDLIFEDLKSAKELMQVQKQKGAYLYRFSKDAITAFEARMFLYRGEWQKAYDAAVSLPGYALVDLNVSTVVKPFASQSTEAILALEKPSTDDFIPSATGIGSKFQKTGDKRVGVYINKWFDGAFKFISGDRTSFRSSEMYLIAAEAMARLSIGDSDPKLAIAKAKLKALQVTRFDSTAFVVKEAAVSAMTRDELLDEIASERVRELFMEGHRWLDLKRTTRQQIIKSITDADWNTIDHTLAKDDPRYMFDFPRSAIAANPELSR